jgi:folate-binding protein YgfZ
MSTAFIFHPNLEPHSPWQTRWVSLEGPDARDFLHRLTTARAHAMNPGDGALACFLNAQGKIRAVFTLWCLEENHFGLEVPAGADGRFHRELLAAIDQYTFAEKMNLSDIPDDKFACAWIFPNPAEDSAVRVGTQANSEEIRLNNHGTRDFGRQWLSAWGRPERLRQWLDREYPGAAQLPSENLNDWRVQSCRPWVGAEISDAVTPLDIGIPDSVVENKGCYPGQEVIEKIAALGSPARRLVLAANPSGTIPERGQKLFSLSEGAPMELGEVTSVSASGFLAIVRKTHARQNAELKLPAGDIASVVKVAPYLQSEHAGPT